MRRIFTVTLAIAAPFVLSAQARPASPPFPMGWLAGCWTMRAGSSVVQEDWMAEKAGAMLGMGRTVRDNRMTETEFIILVQAGDSLHYKARAGRQAEVTFTARAPFGDEIIFENPAHDFPKRVGYKHVSKDSLEAWIDGGAGGGGRRIGFGYHRAVCSAP